MKRIISAVVVLAVVGSALAFKVKTNPNVSECVNHQCELRNFSDFQPSGGGSPVDPGFTPYTGTGTCDQSGATCLPTTANIYANS